MACRRSSRGVIVAEIVDADWSLVAWEVCRIKGCTIKSGELPQSAINSVGAAEGGSTMI